MDTNVKEQIITQEVTVATGRCGVECRGGAELLTVEDNFPPFVWSLLVLVDTGQWRCLRWSLQSLYSLCHHHNHLLNARTIIIEDPHTVYIWTISTHQ